MSSLTNEELRNEILSFYLPAALVMPIYRFMQLLGRELDRRLAKMTLEERLAYISSPWFQEFAGQAILAAELSLWPHDGYMTGQWNDAPWGKLIADDIVYDDNSPLLVVSLENFSDEDLKGFIEYYSDSTRPKPTNQVLIRQLAEAKRILESRR